MKKYIFSAIAALALSCTFVACGDDNEDPSYSYSSSAEQGSAGTYNGKWTRSSDTDGTLLIEEYVGSITLTASNSANVTNVTFSCPNASLDATSVANVWHANNGYGFLNQVISDDNKLGAAFSGRIDEAGNMDASFTLSQRVGRKSYDYVYVFKGKK